MTETTIRFNYQEAMARARELDSAADDLERTKRELDGALHQVSSGWKGDSATQYERKGEQLKEQMQDGTKDLRSAANAVRKIANTIRDMELRNLEIARKRTY